MLRINKRTDYAVRVMLALAKRDPGCRLSTQAIQKEMLVPHAFLQRIVADLARAGLLSTQPGPNGGIQLARPRQLISLRDIYEAIEGRLLISECLEAPGTCPLDSGCPVNRYWCKLQEMFVGELGGKSLQQLSEEANALALKPA